MSITTTAEDEALNRAIAASLQDINNARTVFTNPEPVHIDEEVKVNEPQTHVKNNDGKPGDPPPNPPIPGMKLKTIIKNGWVTKEWRIF